MKPQALIIIVILITLATIQILSSLKQQYPQQYPQQYTQPVVVPIRDIVTEHDYRNVSDPLKEPSRRPARYEIEPLIGNPHLNIPTRGYPDSMSMLGYLTTETGDNKIVKLYGRQKFPNSNEYEYYVEINNNGDMIKYELRNNKELYDDDKVYVDLLKKTYTVKLHKMHGLEYNPYLW